MTASQVSDFHLDQAGEYTVTTSGPSDGQVALGRSPFSVLARGIGEAVLIGVLGFLVALIALIVLARKRGKAKRAMAPALTGGYGFGAPGFAPQYAAAGYPGYGTPPTGYSPTGPPPQGYPPTGPPPQGYPPPAAWVPGGPSAASNPQGGTSPFGASPGCPGRLPRRADPATPPRHPADVHTPGGRPGRIATGLRATPGVHPAARVRGTVQLCPWPADRLEPAVGVRPARLGAGGRGATSGIPPAVHVCRVRGHLGSRRWSGARAGSRAAGPVRVGRGGWRVGRRRCADHAPAERSARRDLSGRSGRASAPAADQPPALGLEVAAG